MSTVADDLSELLAEQRADEALWRDALAASTHALDACDLVLAEAHGRRAEAIMDRIRARSHRMASIVEPSRATDSAGG